MHLRRHLPSHSEYSCQCVCPVVRTALGEKNLLSCQTIPARSTVLALLADSDVLTIPSVWKLEQLFFIMRIAVIQVYRIAKTAKPKTSEVCGDLGGLR
jgi:hypothetical protein